MNDSLLRKWGKLYSHICWSHTQVLDESVYIVVDDSDEESWTEELKTKEEESDYQLTENEIIRVPNCLFVLGILNKLNKSKFIYYNF